MVSRYIQLVLACGLLSYGAAGEVAPVAVPPTGRLDVAVPLAEVYLGKARVEGDPRWVGRAQSVLAPWWQMPEPPVKVLVLRAVIRQSGHDFAGSLADLDLALRGDNPPVRAQLTKVAVLQVLGQLKEAREACEPLQGRVSPVVYETAVCGVESLSGKAEASFNRLMRVVSRRGGGRVEQAWAWCVLGEIAVRLGDLATAEQCFCRGMAEEPLPNSALCEYADLLLGQSRWQSALVLTGARRTPDVLVRRIEAQRGLGMPESANGEDLRILRQQTRPVATRFGRGDAREAALFQLRIARQPSQALDAALTNWQVQKEPIDARLVLEAAVGAGKPEAAEPVIRWLRETGLEDARLSALIAQLL